MLPFRLATCLSLVLLSLGGPVKATEPTPDDCNRLSDLGVPQYADLVLCKRAFLVGYSYQTKTPAWTIERMSRTRIPISRGEESGSFAPDVAIPLIHRAALVDYTGSGFDRGHLVAAGNHVDDAIALAETYLFSNVAPQVGSGFNRGIWKSLEEAVRNYAQCSDDLYVITGVYFPKDATTMRFIGAGRVGVPLGFYKVLYEPKKNRMIAFIAKNEPHRRVGLASLATSVDAVESVSGQTFFDQLPSPLSAKIKSIAPNMEWTIAQEGGRCVIQ